MTTHTYIHYKALKVPENRQRTEHDINAHQDLIESIQRLGLMHPPVVRTLGDDYVLVAGERRLRAMVDIIELGGAIKCWGVLSPSEMIPYTHIGALSPLDAEEAELDENIKRVDLTWQERAKATARLEDFRKRSAEAQGLPAPSRVAFVAEIRGKANANDQTEVRNDLILAQHLDNPEIAKAKTAREAVKVLKNIERTRLHTELAVAVGKSFSSSDHTILNRDSLAWMMEEREGQFDVILTDPPYGMGADTFNNSGGLAAGSHFYEDSDDILEGIMSVFAEQSYRITKPQAHLYCFCDIDKFAFLRQQFFEAGWSVFRTPLIWYKPNGQRAPWPEHGPQRKYELVLFAEKGKKPIQKLVGDVLTYPADDNLGHNAQKPVGLYGDLLSRSVTPGDKVLDPFAGTGPIVPAAHALKCFSTAVEKDTAAYGIILKRLEGLV